MFKDRIILVKMELQTPHLRKVLVDGCESLAPGRLLQEYAEVGVGEPAPFQSLALCNAENTNASQTPLFLFHSRTCSTKVSDIWIFTNLASS